uniref:Uncharacterized protein n=1 Tax=Arundo donax TaxID=35708 RepID=A0A0A9C496_ARUDO
MVVRKREPVQPRGLAGTSPTRFRCESNPCVC